MRWLYGLTNFTLMFSSSRYFLTALEATFSMMLNTVLKPLFVRYVMFSLKFTIVEAYVNSFNGVASIEFDNQSYSTKISVLLSLDIIGNFPVWLTYIVQFFGFMVA